MNRDSPSLTIWCNNDFSAEDERARQQLIEGAGNHSIIFCGTDGTQSEDLKALQTAEIAFGFPDAGAVCLSSSLRWIQLNAAGYTSFDRTEIKNALTSRGTIVTNSSDVYAEPCAQHILAMITSLARGLPVALDAQRGARSWRQSLRP